MYPNLYYAFKDLFGWENLRALRFVNSFGFFVALAFLLAAYLLAKELKRKEAAGWLNYSELKLEVGKPATVGEMLLNALLGFFLGYKFIGLFLAEDAQAADPQAFIFSSAGNWPVGIALALFFAGVKWYEKNRVKMDKPETRIIRIWPHDRVGDIVIYAAIFGFLGAKIFHNLENWNEFWKSPIEALLSFSGLTFYGGLICATLAIWIYAKKNKIKFRHLCDSAAPALMIAYAVGRIGCQVSGDGDWGILNSAYILDNEGIVIEADSTTFNQHLDANARFYTQEFQVASMDQVPHKTVKAPSFLPVWMVAYQYPHNVISHGKPIPDCEGGMYCSQLPSPVFPTPFYETIMASLIFIFLWYMRKKWNVPGRMFSVYLILNGLERFLIERIRVNTTYDINGFHPTQAQLISFGLILVGTLLFFLTKRMEPAPKS